MSAGWSSTNYFIALTLLVTTIGGCFTCIYKAGENIFASDKEKTHIPINRDTIMLDPHNMVVGSTDQLENLRGKGIEWITLKDEFLNDSLFTAGFTKPKDLDVEISASSQDGAVTIINNDNRNGIEIENSTIPIVFEVN